MIAIIDYDAGNIMSVQNALAKLGEQAILTRDTKTLLAADKVILPGVGCFGDCMDNLNKYNLGEVIKKITDKGTPFLGVCLGMQMLFEMSEESPDVKGLGLLKGKIKRIPAGEYKKIPHMGWNSLELLNNGRLFEGLGDNPYVYFVHSYYLDADDKSVVVAKTNYNVSIDAAVEKGNIFGCQFHPEKSSDVGLKILRNFIDL